MATKKPRINVVIDQHNYDVIRQFCELNNQSMSGFVSSLLESAVSSLRKVVAVVDVARALEGEARAAYVEDLEHKAVSAEAAYLQLLGVEGGGNNPRACNTGVKGKVGEKNQQWGGSFPSSSERSEVAGGSVAAAKNGGVAASLLGGQEVAA